jgi:hypothetical protein
MASIAEKIMDLVKGMEFYDAKPIQGQARIIGTFPDKLTAIELIGLRERVSRITVLGTCATSFQKEARRTGLLMVSMLDLLFPYWQGRHQWLIAHINASNVHQKLYTSVQPAGIVSLRYNKKTGILALNIRLMHNDNS